MDKIIKPICREEIRSKEVVDSRQAFGTRINREIKAQIIAFRITTRVEIVSISKAIIINSSQEAIRTPSIIISRIDNRTILPLKTSNSSD